jgi:hypothetical protein
MTDIQNVEDVMMIEEAIKILQSYKMGGINEKDCLIRLLKHFEKHGEIKIIVHHEQREHP